MAAMPLTRSLGRGVGDTRMMDMYSEYAGNWLVARSLAGTMRMASVYVFRSFLS